MKKQYIIPEMATMQVAQSLPIAGSLNNNSATFFNEDATGAAMVKGSTHNYSVWDDDWSATEEN